MTEKEILETTYFDLCTVKRKVKTVNSTTKVSSLAYATVTGYSNLKCALSEKGLKATNQTDTKNGIVYTSVLFISPIYLIKAGDAIEVTLAANSETRKFYASEPIVYSSHQEVLISRNDKA